MKVVYPGTIIPVFHMSPKLNYGIECGRIQQSVEQLRLRTMNNLNLLQHNHHASMMDYQGIYIHLEGWLSYY